LLTIWQLPAIIFEDNADHVVGVGAQRFGKREGKTMPAIAKAAEAGKIIAQTVSNDIATMHAIDRYGNYQPLSRPVRVSGPARDDPAGYGVDVPATHERKQVPQDRIGAAEGPRIWGLSSAPGRKRQERRRGLLAAWSFRRMPRAARTRLRSPPTGQ
jgi:hypothetical protein